MEGIARIAAFNGGHGTGVAIDGRLAYAAGYVDDNGLTLPDGIRPFDDQPCVTFVPEADMYGFDKPSLACRLMPGTNGGYRLEETPSPTDAAHDPDSFLGLLFEELE